MLARSRARRRTPVGDERHDLAGSRIEAGHKAARGQTRRPGVRVSEGEGEVIFVVETGIDGAVRGGDEQSCRNCYPAEQARTSLPSPDLPEYTRLLGKRR